MSKSFLVCSKRQPESAWQISSWSTDPDEAARRENRLVIPPYMDAAAAVYEVGGSAAMPIFFQVSVVTRAQAKEQL